MPGLDLARIRASLGSNKLSVVQAKDDTTKAEIILYGDIGGGFWSEGITAQSLSDELAKLPASVKEITVRVNSPGGNVFDGITIYNRLKQHKAKIIVKIDGLAASIASIIALAGDEVEMGEGAMFMIHKPWTVAMGNNEDLEYTSGILLQLEDQMLDIYQRRSNLSRETLAKMLRDETWIDAKTAQSYGFVDKIDGESLPIAASAVQKEWIKRSPKIEASLDKAVREQAKELQSQIAAILNKK